MAETKWTDGELRVALNAYLEVLAWDIAGRPFSPTALHRKLANSTLATRAEGAIARRMSNISAVLLGAGEPISPRYKPSLNHVGSGVETRLLSILQQLRTEACMTTESIETLNAAAATLSAATLLKPPSGQSVPSRSSASVTVFARSPAVVAWVLKEANGRCDACEFAAPFVAVSGRPFLEVHHLRQLAHGGPDTIDNAVAVCPNCHRRLHHGQDAAKYRLRVIKRLPRLIDHPVKMLA